MRAAFEVEPPVSEVAGVTLEVEPPVEEVEGAAF